MRTRVLQLAISTVLLVAGASIAACGGDESEKASFTLRIGDLVPLTGALSDFGEPGRKAADLALDQIETAIKESASDQRVVIRHADDGTDPRAGLQAARRLVDSKHVTCLAGPWALQVSLRVARAVSIPKKVLQISPTASDGEITKLRDDGFVNSTALPDLVQGRLLAEAIEDDLRGARGKTVNIGARNDSYGTGHADVFEEAWRRKGGDIGQKVTYDPDQRSYASEGRRITSGDPDAFVIIDFPESYNKLAPVLVRSGRWDPGKTWVTDGLAADVLAESAGREATEDVRGTIPGAPDEGAAPEAFEELYAESPPRQTERMIFDAQNFDAVILCYLAAVAAGSSEGADMADEVRGVSAPPGNKFTFQQLPEAVEALADGEDIDYDGASGPIDMNEAGDAATGVYDLFRYRRGRLDVFDEVPVVGTGEGSEGGE
jgi:ABC-type branched-subunit amino acid transport system substrate-binding protein